MTELTGMVVSPEPVNILSNKVLFRNAMQGPTDAEWLSHPTEAQKLRNDIELQQALHDEVEAIDQDIRKFYDRRSQMIEQESDLRQQIELSILLKERNLASSI